MIRSAIAFGFGCIVRRRGLVVLLYLVTLGLAVLLAVPVMRVIGAIFGSSGFSPELAERFDVVLWADWFEKGASGIAAAFSQFIWAVPLFAVWKVAVNVGLVHALRDGGQAGFWEGVGRFTLRGLALALIYLLLAAIIVGALWIVLARLLEDMGEVGQFWTALVVGPLLTVAILATLDLMHDYARIRLVTRSEGVWRSFAGGSFWPLRRISAIFLYKLWFILAAVLWLLPFWLDLELLKTSIWGMMGAFVLQQVVILGRQAASVGWIGAEVAYFEDRFVPPAPAEPGDGPGSGERTTLEDPTAEKPLVSNEVSESDEATASDEATESTSAASRSEPL